MSEGKPYRVYRVEEDDKRHFIKGFRTPEMSIAWADVKKFNYPKDEFIVCEEIYDEETKKRAEEEIHRAEFDEIKREKYERIKAEKEALQNPVFTQTITEMMESA